MANFGGFQRNVTVTRVNTATTTTVPAGAQAVSVLIHTSGGVSSPTVQGTAVPVAGVTLNFNALDTETLQAVAVVTSSGDDVFISVIR